jgi:hypothetical protein
MSIFDFFGYEGTGYSISQELGKRDQQIGRTSDSNPYENGTEKSKAWLKGWFQGQQENQNRLNHRGRR